MGGLLYKDFVSVRGKFLVYICLILTVVFCVLRISFPGNIEASGTLSANDIIMRDCTLMAFPLCLIIAATCLINGWISKLAENDNIYKTRMYINSFPLEQETYIASKYIFIAVAVYIFMSAEIVWSVIFNGLAGEIFYNMFNAFKFFLVPLNCCVLFIASVEFPLYILLGEKKAKIVKTAFMEMLGFLVVAYAFFGDLELLVNLDMSEFGAWCQKHNFALTLVSTLLPLIVLIWYYFSYRFTCHFASKERVYE